MSTQSLRVLYICYLSLDDPLTHTQVVAYLRGLSQAGHEIHLLTFEKGPLARARRRSLRAQMAAEGIIWHGLRYHKRPSLPATLYDTLAGALYGAALMLRYRLDTIHARSHVPAAMALLIRCVHADVPPALIFDVRGLMAEEYVDAGRWRNGGMPFRLTKCVERAALRSADGIVVLTERVRAQLFGAGADERVHVIPCCADLEQITARGRASRRAKLGFGSEPVMLYVGKLTGWYMAAEMADFYAAARELIPRLRFLVLTQDDDAALRIRLGQLDIDNGVLITSCDAKEVGGYLAAADFAIGFIRPAPSKASSSPTKIGEYLAAGLPVMTSSGVGDLDTLLTPDIGVLVSEYDRRAYLDAVRRVAALVADPSTASRCRQVAEEQLSLAAVGVPRYLALYRHVAGVLTSRDGAGRSRA